MNMQVSPDAFAQVSEEFAPARVASAREPLAMLVVLLGAVWMAALAFQLLMPPPAPFIGSRLYDLYTLALLDGRFDLPLRELQLEGHYAPDGTGYLYHGLGPVLTRLPFAAFVDLPTWWIAPASIWFWAVLGNLFYHRAFFCAVAHSRLGQGGISSRVQILLAVLVWFAGPGALLAANGSVFYEPVAMAYAMAGGFVMLLVRALHAEIPLDRALLPMALFAGLALHARPSLAIGLYAACCLIGAMIAFRGTWTQRKRVAGAMALLGLFGAILLACNTARFGNPASMHGGFEDEEVQYGFVYWSEFVYGGASYDNDERTRSIRDDGKFSPVRIVPNLAMYMAALPTFPATTKARDAMERAFIALQPHTGYVRVENPNIGMLFLWPLPMLLAVFGLVQRRFWRGPALAGAIGLGGSAVLLLSYITITLRYHVDLWQALAFAALLGVAPVAERLTDRNRRHHMWCGLVIAFLLVGLAITAKTVGNSRRVLGGAQQWPKELCLQMTAQKGFTPARSEQLCRLKDD
jgi:hypothetical protein